MYLKDYILKYKDEVLTKDTFNEPDGALLAIFSLARVSSITYKNKAITFKTAMENYQEKYKVSKMGVLLPLSMTKVLINASTLKRYRGIIIHDVQYILDEKEETQTLVFQMRLKDNTEVVVFGSTDDTIVGWKENFNMVYSKTTPCAKHSLEYVDNHMKPDTKYIFVGHSKGGMESMYSGLMCLKYQDNILDIYSFDGPGYNKVVNAKLKKSPLLNKVHFIVPWGTCVGALFNHPIKPTIVYSNEIGLMQHNPLSWKIIDKSFLRKDDYQPGSELLPKSLNEANKNFNQLELKHFEELVFGILKIGNSITLTDSLNNRHTIEKEFAILPLKDKRLYLKFIRYLVRANIIKLSLIKSKPTKKEAH